MQIKFKFLKVRKIKIYKGNKKQTNQNQKSKYLIIYKLLSILLQF